MKKRLFMISVIVILAVPFVGLSDAQRDRSFSNADIRGSYGFSFDGQLFQEPFVGPVTAVGIITGDGQGNFTAVRTIKLNDGNGGLVLRQTAVGTYQVFPDGTSDSEFTITTFDPPGFPTTVETFSAVINPRSRNIPFMSTGPGIVAQGIAWQQ